MEKKVTLATIYLKSGNIVTIDDYLSEINKRKTVKYFELILDRLGEGSVNGNGISGYIKYDHTLILMNSIDSIKIDECLYDIPLSSSKDPENKDPEELDIVTFSPPKAEFRTENGRSYYIE